MTAALTPTVVLDRISRWYGPVIGLNDVSLTLEPGVTGLLGPNGAGKSTLLKIVTGQLRPSQGLVQVFGERVFGNSAVFSRLGVCPDHEEMWEHLSGRQHVESLLRLGGFARAEARRLAGDTLERVGLGDSADRRVGGYSKGMRQRVRIAVATAHDPDLVILDEPLTGMDPVGRGEIIDYVRALADRGKTILLSGHVLHEVERMTRRIILIHKGQVLAEGTLAEIRRALDQRPHRIEVGTPEPRKTALLLMEDPGVVKVAVFERRVELEVIEVEPFFRRLMKLCRDGAVQVDRYESTVDNLQAIFDYLIA